MQLGDVLDDGKAEAGSAKGTAAVLVDAVEALEETRLAVRRDADAVVADADYGLAVGGGFDLDHDVLGAAVAQGVLNEVGDRRFQEPRIAGADES